MTSIRHRLLIDECLPPKLITAYLKSHIGLSGDGVDAVHIKVYLGGGKKDPEWVPKIAKDRRWCVLSEDRGSHSARHDALPIVCFEYGVTLIRLSSPVVKKKITFYGPQILANWPSIMGALRGPKGAQYLLRQHNTRSTDTHLQAVRAPNGFTIEKGVLVKQSKVVPSKAR